MTPCVIGASSLDSRHKRNPGVGICAGSLDRLRAYSLDSLHLIAQIRQAQRKRGIHRSR
jgi:hypothetical protein